MKNINLFFFRSVTMGLAMVFTNLAFAQPTDIFISEYIEGSSNNKALELFNGTSAAIDLGSSQYVLELYFNGNSTPSSTIVLTGTMQPGSTYVIGHSSAVLSYTPNLSTSSLSFNGDDAIILKKGGSSGPILDVIGQVGTDPGTQWGANDTATADRTIRRKLSICQGDVTTSNSFFVSQEWDGYALNTFGGLGSHSVSCGSTSLSPGLSLSAASLSFVTLVNNPSPAQAYLLTGTSLTTAVTLTAPAFFELSINANGPFSSSLSIPQGSFSTAAATIFVRYNPSSTGTATGNVIHSSGSFSASLSLSGLAVTVTSISAIQGSLTSSTFTNQTIATEGIVTGDYQGTNELGGFYIQDPIGDGNPASSEGIFVSNTSFSVNTGDYVQLIGTVEEFFGRTQLKAISSLTIQSSGNVIAPTSFSLPVQSSSDFETVEGMRVQFNQTLTVSEVYTLARYGEVLLSGNGRLVQPTNFIDPNDIVASGTSTTGTSNVSSVSNQQSLNNLNQITLDDKSNVQNPATVPYLDLIDNTLRCGSTLANLDGIMDYSFSLYRIQPLTAPAFTYAARPSVPSVGTTNVKVASFNVLNYFNGNGLGGGFPTSRGANTSTEFNRQRNKIIAAITQLNADVVGLMEMENDGDGSQSAIQDLVNGLNAVSGTNTYTFVPDPSSINGGTGTDEIKVALIYKPGVVTCTGSSIADNSSAHNRPPLAQTFMVNSNQEKFSVIVSHFKSKGCSGASGLNTDQSDGQGCYNDSRKQQAIALLNFIATVKTQASDNDVLSIGDFNAYEQEDPVDVFLANGLNLLLNNTYSYVFDGQCGSLDHAFGTLSLIAQVTGAGKWHINADEPIAKDYNQEFNPAYMYSADPYRSSDHDPLIIGLNLQPAASLSVASIQSVSCNGQATGSATVAGNGGYGPLSYTWAPTGGNSSSASGLSAGIYTVSVSDGTTSSSKTLSIAQPSASLQLSILNQTSVTCHGGSSGSATVLATGGTGTISYLWAPGSAASAVNFSMNAGVYTVTSTDANSCSETKTLNISQPSPVLVSVLANSVSCNGLSNGSATATATGGSGSYTYSWSPLCGNTNTAGTLASGVYTISIQDANACLASTTVFISQPSPLTTSLVGTKSVSCYGLTNGSATVTAAGGNPVYTYSWTPSGGNSSSASSLSSGVYTVLITDLNLCASSVTVGIIQPSAITMSLAGSSSVTCYGLSNGSATYNASGGTGGLSYSWLPGGNVGLSNSSLSAGLYTVTVNDANLCSISQTLFIAQPNTISLSIVSFSNVSCYGLSDGSATASASGGTGGFTYSWSAAGSTLNSVYQLAPGLFTVTAMDANACSANQTVSISQPQPIDVSTFVNGAVISANASGLSYQWINCSSGNSLIPGATGQTFSATSSGSYAVIITKNTCTDTSACVNIVLTGLSEKEQNLEIELFPNPVSSDLTIQSENSIIEELSVYNEIGQRVLSLQIDSPRSTISLADQPNGIYVLRLKTKHGSIAKKIIKQN